MAVFDKWVVLKIVEFVSVVASFWLSCGFGVLTCTVLVEAPFLFCVACLVAKRVSQDDEARLALLLQKLSREWSLLTSVTWDSVGGAFADAVYGGYVIITFVLVVARIVQEIPRGRRILEGLFLGFGMLFFIIIGGLELASLDSVPQNLVVNASVLGSFSLFVAALFLVDLMGPRTYISTSQSQTDPISSPKSEKKVSIAPAHKDHNQNGLNQNGLHQNGLNQNGVNQKGHLGNGTNGHIPERPKDLDLEAPKTRPGLLETSLDELDTKLSIEDGLESSKFGSLRNIEGGNYVKLSEPLSDKDRRHYERELARFHEKYFREFIDNFAGRLPVKEDYLPEPQTPVFSKVKTGRLKDLYDDSPNYEKKSPSKAKVIPSPTLQQLEDYLKGGRNRRADTPALFPMEPIEEKAPEMEGRASGTPTDPGYVQYTAGKWPDKQRELRTPRHSPT